MLPEKISLRSTKVGTIQLRIQIFLTSNDPEFDPSKMERVDEYLKQYSGKYLNLASPLFFKFHLYLTPIRFPLHQDLI
jgi:hypothetical protein